MRPPALLLLALPCLVALAACVHAGQLPSGPPPEYEETPLPTNASIDILGDASVPKPPASEPPAHP